MLQQTRVETAIPYYRRFLARFPDVASLAGSDEAEVLTLWSGLGYYRRCRGLLAAAKEIVARGGALPRSARELERLPGIGPYTAAAIASIAFAEPVPVLDGNVERVVCRYSARNAGAQRKSDRSALLAIAASLLDPERPGDSNQALMELGATVCTPRAPGCSACPLADGCQARAQGAPESFPAAARRPGVERVRQLVAFVEEGGRVLLFRRSPAAGQLAGLWEFPAVDLDGPRPPEALLSSAFGGRWTLGEEMTRLRHAITTRSFAIEVRRAFYGPGGEAERDTVAEGSQGGVGSGEAAAEPGWWSRDAAAGLPLTGVARKVLARAGNQSL
jgi:A/G-specific adenine glycosylase